METESLPAPSDQDLINATVSCLNPANCTQLWGLPAKQCSCHFHPQPPCQLQGLDSFFSPLRGEQNRWNGLEQFGNEGGLEFRELWNPNCRVFVTFAHVSVKDQLFSSPICVVSLDGRWGRGSAGPSCQQAVRKLCEGKIHVALSLPPSTALFPPPP